jgi:hypothetical protein
METGLLLWRSSQETQACSHELRTFFQCFSGNNTLCKNMIIPRNVAKNGCQLRFHADADEKKFVFSSG